MSNYWRMVEINTEDPLLTEPVETGHTFASVEPVLRSGGLLPESQLLVVTDRLVIYSYMEWIVAFIHESLCT